MANLPSWVAPMKPVQASVPGLQNLAQTYTHPHNARTGGWDGQGVDPNRTQQPQQTGLQGLESRISPEMMQFLQPFMGMMNGQGGSAMKGLLGFQPVDHNPFQQNAKPGGGGLYGS